MSAKSWHPDAAAELAVRHPDGTEMILLPAPQVYFSERRLQELVRICNAPDIIEMIRLAGIPVGDRYTRRNATQFLKYAFEGWEDSTHFVFFLMAPARAEKRSELAGCLELRSPGDRSFEAGYWIAPEWRGVGALSLSVLVSHAKERGVEEIWARVLATNAASLRLLAKLQFKREAGSPETAGGVPVLRMAKLLGHRPPQRR